MYTDSIGIQLGENTCKINQVHKVGTIEESVGTSVFTIVWSEYELVEKGSKVYELVYLIM